MAAGLEVLGRSGRGGGNREQPVPGPDGRARRAARAATDATRRWARRAGGVPKRGGNGDRSTAAILLATWAAPCCLSRSGPSGLLRRMLIDAPNPSSLKAC